MIAAGQVGSGCELGVHDSGTTLSLISIVTGGIMAKPLELINVKDLTICESTAQMITKARNDGVELFFDRAQSMKA